MHSFTLPLLLCATQILHHGVSARPNHRVQLERVVDTRQQALENIAVNQNGEVDMSMAIDAFLSSGRVQPTVSLASRTMLDSHLVRRADTGSKSSTGSTLLAKPTPYGGSPQNSSTTISSTSSVTKKSSLSVSSKVSSAKSSSSKSHSSKQTPKYPSSTHSSTKKSQTHVSHVSSTKTVVSSTVSTVNSATSPTGSTSGGGSQSFPPGLPLEQCLAMADGIVPNWAGADFEFSGNVRTYYMAAEMLEWNYAPTGWDNWLGVPIEQSTRAFVNGFLKSTGSLGGGAGLTWQKAKYVGYTDSSFGTKSEQPPWLGLNGPIMRAEVGDLVQVVLKNSLPSNYINVHSMGLGYDKANIGAVYPSSLYPDLSEPVFPGNAIPPGGCFTYKWIVGPTNAPAPGFTSHLWSYHPYVNMPNDLIVGFAGPFIVYGRGQMESTMANNREFILTYQGYPEFVGWLDTVNVAKYAPELLPSLQAAAAANPPPIPTNFGNASIWGPQLTNSPRLNLSQAQGPVFQTLNGYVFANSPPFELCQGDSAIWYIQAYGFQSHTFHLHGNNFAVAGESTPHQFYRASLSLNNGEMYTIQMNASRPGNWAALCHVSTHLASGMENYYNIYDRSSCPLAPLPAQSGTSS